MEPYKVTILTLYPDVFTNSLLNYSILKRAQDKNLWDLKVINIRDFGIGNYKRVDDTLYGGGSGLLLKPDVVSAAIEYAFLEGASKNLILLSPAGEHLSQKVVKSLSIQDGITIICGHFEGIDYRIVKKYQPIELSLGDFIMSGGEIAAMAIIDACIRLLPLAVNSKESLINESFEGGLLEEPQYTKPYDFNGLEVPEVLCSGDHKKIAAWRKAAKEELTKEKRPDLWEKYKKGVNND